jgi:hypothetical protein
LALVGPPGWLRCRGAPNRTDYPGNVRPRHAKLASISTRLQAGRAWLRGVEEGPEVPEHGGQRLSHACSPSSLPRPLHLNSAVSARGPCCLVGSLSAIRFRRDTAQDVLPSQAIKCERRRLRAHRVQLLWPLSTLPHPTNYWPAGILVGIAGRR